MERVNKSITELINQNPDSAKVLHSLGIYFYNYSEDTLGEICDQRGIKPEFVIQKLNNAVESPQDSKLRLEDYPIELIIAYLKHSHYVFIKDRLKYLGNIIENYPEQDTTLMADIKAVFPEFAREFIEHVYEEEDTVFTHILQLKKIQENKAFIDPKDIQFPNQSIQTFEEEHHHNDDEMKGLRELTKNYQYSDSNDPHAKVILDSLRKFHDELKNHAKIENDILFPRALKLENEVKSFLSL